MVHDRFLRRPRFRFFFFFFFVRRFLRPPRFCSFATAPSASPSSDNDPFLFPVLVLWRILVRQRHGGRGADHPRRHRRHVGRTVLCRSQVNLWPIEAYVRVAAVVSSLPDLLHYPSSPPRFLLILPPTLSICAEPAPFAAAAPQNPLAEQGHEQLMVAGDHDGAVGEGRAARRVGPRPP